MRSAAQPSHPSILSRPLPNAENCRRASSLLPPRGGVPVASVLALAAFLTGPAALGAAEMSGTVAIEAAVSPLQGWIERLQTMVADRPDAELAIADLNKAKLGAAVFGVDLSEPIRGRATFEQTAGGVAERPRDASIVYGTLRPLTFDRRRLVPRDPGQLFVPGDGPLGRGEIAFAASDGRRVLLTLAESQATQRALAAWKPSLQSLDAGRGEPLLGSVADGAGASTALVAVDLSEASAESRRRGQTKLRDAFRKLAREAAADKAKSASERQVGLELLKLIESTVAPFTRADELTAAIELADDAAVRLAVAADWESDAAERTLAELPPRGSVGDGWFRPRPVARFDLHLSVPAAASARLQRVVELVADAATKQAKQEGTTDYVQPTIDAIEAELLRTLQQRELNGSLAIVVDRAAGAPPTDEAAAFAFGMKLDDPPAILAAMKSFVRSVGGGEMEAIEASGVAWSRVPSDDPDAQPFWVGADEVRLWIVVGPAPPDRVIGQTTRSTPRAAQPSEWFEAELDFAALRTSRQALVALGLDLPPASELPVESGRTRLTLGPRDGRVVLDAALPGPLVRRIAADAD